MNLKKTIFWSILGRRGAQFGNRWPTLNANCCWLRRPGPSHLSLFVLHATWTHSTDFHETWCWPVHTATLCRVRHSVYTTRIGNGGRRLFNVTLLCDLWAEEQTVCAVLLGQFLQERGSLANRDEWLTVGNVSMASNIGLSETRTTVIAAANKFGLLRT